MHLACLPHGSSGPMLRRVLAGVPDAGVLVLPASTMHRDGGEWLLGMMKELRRELFLQPELSVLASIDPAAVNHVTVELARTFCESHSHETTIGRVHSVASSTTIVEWLAAGETLEEELTHAELNENAVLHTTYVELGSAPVVEATQSSASVVVSSKLSPGSLALAAAYEQLSLASDDWDRLATAVTLARVVEQPRDAAPLWLEIDDQHNMVLVALPTVSRVDLDYLLDMERIELLNDGTNADVSVDLVDARWHSIGLGRFMLTGVKGSPPSGRYRAELVYSLRDSQETHAWPTTVSRTLVDWDASVRSAKHWLDEAS